MIDELLPVGREPTELEPEEVYVVDAIGPEIEPIELKDCELELDIEGEEIEGLLELYVVLELD